MKKNRYKKLLIYALGIVLVFIVAMAFMSWSAKRPDNLGVDKTGKLAPCPASPNCASSQCEDGKHKIVPFLYHTKREIAMNTLKRVVASMPRTKIIKEEDNYLYVEFTSALFRFVDDVEFYFEPTRKVIQMRSASRAGHSDFGANRKRLETIQAKL